MKLIVGLGNPGKQYAKTRHNFGFMVLDSLCSEWTNDAKLSSVKCKVGDILYLKPQQFMNLSGNAVAAAIYYYKIALNDLLVVYDDKDLPLGALRFRNNGSSGGHNGMKSILGAVDSEDIARLKLGIAPVTTDQAIRDTAEYVLAKFSKEEQADLPAIIKEAKDKILAWAK